MPRIPYRKMLFPEQLWKVEGEVPDYGRRTIYDPPMGYVRGRSKAELLRRYPYLRGRTLLRVQGPEFPDDVELHRQAMLNGLDNINKRIEYNRRVDALNEYLDLPRDARKRYEAEFGPIEYEGRPLDYYDLMKMGRDRDIPELPDWIMDKPWKEGRYR